jgi:hypothetical protein
MVENGGGAGKNRWWLDRGKWFLARFCWLLQGEVYPAGRLGPWQGLSQRMDTLSSLSPMRSVKWCRERQRIA